MAPDLTRFDPPHQRGMRFTINGKEVPFEVDFANGIIHYEANRGDHIQGCFSGEYDVTGGAFIPAKQVVKKERKPAQNYLNLRKGKY